MMHLDERAINDFADDLLSPAERVAADDHIAACADCARAVARIRELRAALGSLARDVPPPARTLDAVRTAISAIADGPAAAPSTRPARPVRSRPPVRPRVLAAAAVLLVAVSSATTALLLRSAAGPPAMPSTAAEAPGRGTAARLVAVHALERPYQDEIAQLQRLLAAGATGLSPETLRIIEHNLAIIDGALAEARQALELDPGNDVLAELLRSGYERKLDVLRSAAASARARS